MPILFKAYGKWSSSWLMFVFDPNLLEHIDKLSVIGGPLAITYTRDSLVEEPNLLSVPGVLNNFAAFLALAE